MIELEVGARPSKPLSIAVRDEMDNPVNVMGYSAYILEIMDTNNRPVDMTGVEIVEIAQAVGVFSAYLPKNRTLFPEKGKYLLRLKLLGPDGSIDITRTSEIRVRDFGRLN